MFLNIKLCTQVFVIRWPMPLVDVTYATAVNHDLLFSRDHLIGWKFLYTPLSADMDWNHQTPI